METKGYATFGKKKLLTKFVKDNRIIKLFSLPLDPHKLYVQFILDGRVYKSGRVEPDLDNFRAVTLSKGYFEDNREVVNRI